MLLLELHVQVVHVVQPAAEGVREAAVGGDPGHAGQGEQEQATELNREPLVREVKADGQQRHQQSPGSRRAGDPPLGNGGSSGHREQACDRDHHQVPTAMARGVQRGSRQDQERGDRGKTDPHGERGPS